VEESWTQASSSCLCQKKQGAIGQTTSSWIPSFPQTAFTVVPQIMCKGRRVHRLLLLSHEEYQFMMCKEKEISDFYCSHEEQAVQHVQGKRAHRFLLGLRRFPKISLLGALMWIMLLWGYFSCLDLDASLFAEDEEEEEAAGPYFGGI
jgi:hypothetical protein